MAVNPGEPWQFELEVEAGGADAGLVADALLSWAAAGLEGPATRQAALAVVGATSPAVSTLEERGFELDAEYVLLCHRTTRQVVERRRLPAGMAVPTSG